MRGIKLIFCHTEFISVSHIIKIPKRVRDDSESIVSKIYSTPLAGALNDAFWHSPATEPGPEALVKCRDQVPAQGRPGRKV